MEPVRNPKPKAAGAACSPGQARKRRNPWVTVLYVEDDANDRELLQTAVSEAGVPFRLHTVNDAESAMAYLEGSGIYGNRSRFPMPSLILLDLRMRRSSGIELTKWIRAQPVLSSIPVVVLSGSESEEDMHKVYRCGANGFINKPLGFFALVDMVRQLNVSWFVAPQTAPLEINQQLFRA